MKYKVVFYCPDQHITYNLNTLNKTGVGGGITSRVRIMHALANQGHEVTAYINCPKEEYLDGVSYKFFHQLKDIKTDVFIASSSGDKLDLSSISEINIIANLKILMVHGIDQPIGLNLDNFNFIYCLSNYVRNIAEKKWNINKKNIFVTHRGIKQDFYSKKVNKNIKRDPFSIIYTSHPSKGLDTAKKIVGILRKDDTRFSLHVYGGYELWGETAKTFYPEDGVKHHSLIGQKVLAKKYLGSGFNLNLQTRQEPFGMVIIEAMRAGCIEIASNVGSFPELIHHNFNGFLIDGDPRYDFVIRNVCYLIWEMIKNPGYSSYIRHNAMSNPITWKIVAETWNKHWDLFFENDVSVSTKFDFANCYLCKAKLIPFADGLHCLECGYYHIDSSYDK